MPNAMTGNGSTTPQAEYLQHAYALSVDTINPPEVRKAHRFLSQGAPQPLSKLYAYVFERLLGQKVSAVPQQLSRVHQTLATAAQQNRPALFVLNSQNPPNRTRNSVFALQKRLLDEFQVLHVKANEVPALSQITTLPPLEGAGSKPMLVMRIHEDKLECMRIIDGPGTADKVRTARSLMPGVPTNIALAQALADYYKLSPPKTVDLLRVHRLLKKVDLASAKELEEVVGTTRQREATERRAKLHDPKQADQAGGKFATVN